MLEYKMNRKLSAVGTTLKINALYWNYRIPIFIYLFVLFVMTQKDYLFFTLSLDRQRKCCKETSCDSEAIFASQNHE
jgi:hypothetical protein